MRNLEKYACCTVLHDKGEVSARAGVILVGLIELISALVVILVVVLAADTRNSIQSIDSI